jgi:hypothetical protein
VHNGAPVDFGLLNEKWEALALLPVHTDDKAKGKGKGKGSCSGKNEDEYYLITLSDNDFITDNGASRYTLFFTTIHGFDADTLQDMPTSGRSGSSMIRARSHFFTARLWSSRSLFRREASPLLGKEP